jgi:autophagy-related protein 2
MAYFIPSNIQKRFLRYALSRLELLDNESLDLDQLDIAWGSRSSIELRDVRLNVEVCGNIVTNGIDRADKA